MFEVETFPRREQNAELIIGPDVFVRIHDETSPQDGQYGRIDFAHDYTGLTITTRDGICRNYDPLVARTALSFVKLSNDDPIVVGLRDIQSYGLPDPDGGPDDFVIPPHTPQRASLIEFYRRNVTAELSITPMAYESEHLKFRQARALLLEELAKAHAPVTGREVACVLETGDSTVQFVAGHNYEHQPGQFDHAEPQALTKFLERFGDSRKVKNVFMIGHGQGKEKKISPCFDCFDTLRPHLDDEARIVLFDPKTFTQATVLAPEDYDAAYSAKPYAEITSQHREEIIEELKVSTDLTSEDAALIADLRHAGVTNGIQFYLTGSASGRGWVSNAIQRAKGMVYSDIDIIAVTSLTNDVLEGLVEQTLHAHRPEYNKSRTSHTIWRLGETRQGVAYAANGKPTIELQHAPELRSGMSRQDYFDRNFYIRIS